jgi:hypothetical protein
MVTGSYLQADLEFTDGGAYMARLFRVAADGKRAQLGQLAVSGSRTAPGGFFTLGYRRTFTGVAQFLPFLQVTPTGGALQELVAPSLTEAQDRDLGQVSAIGCNANASILAVSGGSL